MMPAGRSMSKRFRGGLPVCRARHGKYFDRIARAAPPGARLDSVKTASLPLILRLGLFELDPGTGELRKTPEAQVELADLAMLALVVRVGGGQADADNHKLCRLH